MTINRSNEAKIKEITRPFAEAVEEYVMGEFSQMSDALKADIEGHLAQLQRQLALQQRQMESLELPMSLEELKYALLLIVSEGSGVDIEGGDVGKANLFQIILGLIGMDLDVILSGMNGEHSNFEAIMVFLRRNLLEIVAAIIGGPVGAAILIFRISRMIIDMQGSRDRRAANILMGLRSEIVEELRSNEEKYVLELENVLSAITQAGVKMTDGIRNQVKDYEASLDTTIEKLQVEKNSLENETQRTNRIRERLLESMSAVNVALNGKPLDEDEVRKLAVAG